MLKNLPKTSKKILTTPLTKQITTSQQQLGVSLQQKDPQLYDIIEREKVRQIDGINLIASENHCSKAVLEALGSPLMIKYSDGYGRNRLYPGCKFIDQIEDICKERALAAFGLDPVNWGVNVQSYSGCNANFAVFAGVLQPHDRILGLDLPHGGHLSHGFQTRTKKISMVSQFFESLPYRLNEQTGIIDYEKLEELAMLYNPKIIIAGASAYSRLLDYKKYREVANKTGSYLMADMAHISGLVAAGQIPSPFEFCDIVTTTTHKSLRGPRGSLIFYRRGVRSVDSKGVQKRYILEKKINYGVSPLSQNSAHNNYIAAVAVALKQAQSPEFKLYQEQVLKNCQAMATELQRLGYDLVSGGTDNHLLLINLKKSKLDGSRVERLLDILKVSSNKNTIPGDASALNPGGLRVGTPAMTTRGLKKADFVQVAQFLDRAFKLVPKLKKDCGGKKIVHFNQYIEQNHNQIPEIVELRQDILEFSRQFPVPAIEN